MLSDQLILDTINSLEKQFKVNMDKKTFKEESLPAYFNTAVEKDENGHYFVTYNFETSKGSGQILCTYEEKENILVPVDWNEVVDFYTESDNT
tara:strand:+ start:182 stop:460 length:279 start_codon:yes stop_codon:yes gene_type:complete